MFEPYVEVIYQLIHFAFAVAVVLTMRMQDQRAKLLQKYCDALSEQLVLSGQVDDANMDAIAALIRRVEKLEQPDEPQPPGTYNMLTGKLIGHDGKEIKPHD